VRSKRGGRTGHGGAHRREAKWLSGGGGPVDRHRHEAKERGWGDGVLEHAHEGGREGKEKEGAAAMGCPL
jgi:hypothetical protein